jgi:hypothetical protein
MEYICDVKMSDFPCKFFILNVGINTTVKMARFKHINRYLYDIEPMSNGLVYKPRNPVINFKHGEFVYEYEEEPEIDWDLTEELPRMVIWRTELL